MLSISACTFSESALQETSKTEALALRRKHVATKEGKLSEHFEYRHRTIRPCSLQWPLDCLYRQLFDVVDTCNTALVKLHA